MLVIAHDRRPTLADGTRVAGMRCAACGYPIIQPIPRCAECHGRMEATTFDPTGTIAASTCIRVRVPGQQPPFAIAYLDLDGGPRVLVHTGTETILAPGSRARIAGVDEKGDLVAEEIAS